MGDRLTGEYFPSLVLGVIGIGLSLAFVLVGRPTRTTVWLSAAYISVGLTFLGAGLLVDNVPEDHTPAWARLAGLFSLLIAVTTSMYISALADTTSVVGRGRRLLRVTLWLGCLNGLLGTAGAMLFPAAVFNGYIFGLFESHHRSGFGWFVAYAVSSGVFFCAAWALLAFQGVDPGERDRALLATASVPLLAAALVVPYRWSVIFGSVAFVLGMAGVLRYMTVAGARGVFLARFLSPEVLDVVRTGGIQGVTRSQSLELSAVYCDLRGFTAYAEAVPSKAVIDLLGEYYDAIGQVAADAHATIKDYAGDGVLILVGAPIARPDHAEAAMELARAALEACRDVLESWSTGPHPLGLGIGVASGRVTVGAIGSIDRMEYTAVGVPVNLAARLCSSAVSGEILVDQHTADLCSGDGLVQREPIMLKGLSEPQAVYAVLADGS